MYLIRKYFHTLKMISQKNQKKVFFLNHAFIYSHLNYCFIFQARSHEAVSELTVISINIIVKNLRQ